MLLVDGVPVTAPSSQSQGREILTSLLENPTLIGTLDRLKSTPEKKVSGSEPVKLVYVFQNEYASDDPALVHFVGTDEATTCVGLVIRNRETGMTSISHMDFEKVVDMGLSQMLSSLIVNDETYTTLDVHLIGGFDDKENVIILFTCHWNMMTEKVQELLKMMPSLMTLGFVLQIDVVVATKVPRGMLHRKNLQQEFLDHGVLTLLKNWLEPLPDGSLPNVLPNVNTQTAILEILTDFPINLEHPYQRGQLKKSGLGRVIMFLSKTDEETMANRKLARELVNK